MTPSELADVFIASIELRPCLVVPSEQLGDLLSVLPVVGGGAGCIVVIADGMIVRLTSHAGNWIAEHLVVRGREE